MSDKLRVMTESFRRNGEYRQGDQQQAAYSQQPAFRAGDEKLPTGSGSPVNAEWPPPPAYEPTQQAQPAQQAPAQVQQADPTALLTEPVSGASGRRRAKGATALLAAVAIAAAAVGGGTAYAFQELVGNDATT